MDPIELQVHRHPATLRLLVEEKLRMAIAAGHFRPGQRLVERELCALLGVGRTSVREAIRQLEAEGLLVSVPHRGPEVRRITLDEARQLYAFRALLEGHAGEQFARSGTEEERARLGAAIDAFAEAAASGDQARLIATKAQFYDVLTSGGRNVFVSESLRNLHTRITLLRATSMNQPGRLADSLAELRAIEAAIRARAVEAAGAACRFHVEQAARVALAVLEAG